MAIEAAIVRASRRWRLPTLGLVTNDGELKDQVSFAIFWAMWKRQVSPPRLAKAVGKSPDTIRRWRDGETAPSVLDVAPLAKALGVRPDYFTAPPEVPAYPFEKYVTEPVDSGFGVYYREETAKLRVARGLGPDRETRLVHAATGLALQSTEPEEAGDRGPAALPGARRRKR